MNLLEIQGAALRVGQLPPAVTNLRRQLDEPVWQGSPGPASATGLGVTVTGLSQAYGSRTVLERLDLAIAPGEFVAIVGRSGCGKSTLLRLMAGLETVTEGQISLDGGSFAQYRDALRIMFQDARLLPWKRVIDNIALGLPGRDARERAEKGSRCVKHSACAIISERSRRCINEYLAKCKRQYKHQTFPKWEHLKTFSSAPLANRCAGAIA